MPQRRFGPTRAAGVVIIEKEAEKTVQPAALGVTAHVGVYEKGEVGVLNFCSNKRNFFKKMGNRYNGWLAPDAALDFFDLGEGAGEMWAIRVTDGTEKKAVLTLWNRRVPKSPVIKVEAKNGGRWGGKADFHLAEFAAPASTNLLETTLTTGVTTWATNQWAGAVLKFKDLPTKSYTVVSNTSAGVVTVQGDATMSSDYVAAGASSREYTLELENDGKQLALFIKDGQEKPADEWGVEVYLDGLLANKWDNLSSDPNSGRYFVNVINNDGANDEITVTDLWTGGIDPTVRPANHWDEVSILSATVAQVEIVQVAVNSPGGGNATAGGFVYPTSLKRQKLTLTFTSATAFDVVSDEFGAVGSGTIGSLFTPTFGVDYIPKFNITVGASAMATNDTIVMDFHPLPVDGLIGGFVYPDKLGDRRQKFQITDNTQRSATVKPSDDMTTVASAGTKATVTGTATETFNITLSTNDSFDISIDGGVVTTITLTAGGTQSASDIASDINAQFPGLAEDDGTGKVKLTSTIGGRFSKIIVGSGNANATLGFTDDQTYVGASGDEALLAWADEMSGGTDGLGDLADVDYENMYDTSLSPMNQLFGKNKGLVKLGTPGVTSTSVQKKGAAYAEARNYQYRYEVPVNIVTEDAAETYLNDTIGRNDFAVIAFPSYGSMSDPDGEGLKQISLTGAIHGREAKTARVNDGFHKAAAGIDVTLPHILKLPTGDAVLDEEFLNPEGFQIIKFKEGNAIIWGDRTAALDPAWKWKHQREQMSHYENTLRENFDWIIFAINDQQTWNLAFVALQAYFLQEWAKRALRGDSPAEAFSVKIDKENNTNLTISQGDVNAEIRLRLADTVERFIITMSKLGIFEDLG